MAKDKADIFFLLLALLLTVFLNCNYISGLYYDQDVASNAYSTLEVLKGKTWHYDYPIFSGNKPPGINFIFLLAFAIFGKSFISIQIFSLFANLSTVILLYLLAKQILSKDVRLYFLLPLFYALFSASEAIQGHSSNLETFVVPFETAGILLLGLFIKRKKDIFCLFSGLLLGLGFLIKQSTLATFIAGLAFIFVIKIIYREDTPSFLKRALLFISMFLLPLLLASIYFLYLGVWGKFIESIFSTNIRYIKNISVIRHVYLLWAMQQIWKVLKIEIIIFGVFALIGISYSFLRYRKWERQLILFWFVIPVLIISKAGFHFRHHFIEIVPPLLTLSVIGLSDIYSAILSLSGRKKFFLRIFVVLVVYILAFPFFHIIAPLIKKNKLANSFFLTSRYIRNPNNKYAQMLFNESPDAARRFLISQHINKHTTKGDRIFVWDDLNVGSIYLWTGLDNATSFKGKLLFLPKNLITPIFTIPLKENMPVNEYLFYQKALLQEIAKERPVYIVVVQSALSMPNAPLSAFEQLSLEKRAFKDFFDVLERDYYLDGEIAGCFAYRLKNR